MNNLIMNFFFHGDKVFSAQVSYADCYGTPFFFLPRLGMLCFNMIVLLILAL